MASRRSPGTVVKHSVLVAGHSTSISLEEAFWVRLRDVAAKRGQTTAELVAAIDRDRGHANLSSAVRVFLLEAGTVSTV